VNPLRRAGRAVTYFARRYLFRQRHLSARASVHGLRFHVRTEDVVGRRIYKRGIYEPALTAFLLERAAIRPDDLVYDVGANIGWYSILLDAAHSCRVEVHAFEPDPENLQLLRQNVRMNDAANVRVVPCAVADRPGTALLHRYPGKNLGRHSLVPFESDETVAVKTVSLDDYASRRGLDGRSVGLLKIDVEGYEDHVLRGASEVLERCRTVVTEFSPTAIRRGGGDPITMLSRMAASGFAPELVTAQGLRPCDPTSLAGDPGTVDLVWRRSAA
jgi:FkbM family methyltransferase